jgi:hypothetical protein
MTYSINDYKSDIKECIEMCEIELDKRKMGVLGESTIEQLENTIIPELSSLLQNINLDKLPPEKDRYLISFAYAFKVWGWDMQNPTQLYAKLNVLNSNYKKL